MLKSAHELASERIIAPSITHYEEETIFNEKKWDFIPIPEFENKEDVVIESDNIKRVSNNTSIESDIKVENSKTYHYGDKMLEVYWNGQFLDYGGFARMNRMMVFGLSNKNVKVKVEMQPFLTHVNKATQEELKMLERNIISEDAPRVYGATVPSAISNTGKKIVYSMIETSEKSHVDYVGKLNLANEIWTPTNYGKKILENSGIHVPVFVMPLGVDVDRYCPQKSTFDFLNLSEETTDYLNNSFVFISVFRWSYRKGYDILLKAFMEEFGSQDNVSLLIVSRAVECAEELGPQKIAEDFNAIKTSINKSDDELPYVALYTSPIREKDMPKLYNASDAFVLISRGEGYGLIFLESSACGLPVIASNCTGQTDFLNDSNSYLVNPENYVKAEVNGQLSGMAKLCRFYEGQLFPEFGQQSIEKTKEHMRYVYENYEEAKDKNDILRKKINSSLTWDMAVNRVYERLLEINSKKE